MKNIIGAVFLMLIALGCNAKPLVSQNETEENMEKEKHNSELFVKAGYQTDSFTTPKGRQVDISFIKHGSIVIDAGGFMIYVDPVTIYGDDFAKLPKADLIMVTHEHHDHFDVKAIEELTGENTQIIGSSRIHELYAKAEALNPGDCKDLKEADIQITATPAYNITEGHLQFHPKDRKDDGFVFDIDGLRIYVAGDTENIPEMADLKDIDIAFLPVNQPYTMTPEQAIEAVKMFNPKIFYPYHYGETDLSPITENLKGSKTEVRIRQLQ